MEIAGDDKILKEIMDCHNKDNESAEEHSEGRKLRIIKLCQKADVKYDEYIEALETSTSGYSVVLARDLDELFINPYNREWMKAWNANMDIQVVLDFFAVITYVTDYYAKDDTGKADVIKQMLKESQCQSLKEKMRIVANTFLTHRQIGEAEAVYRLIPHLTLTMSNLRCQFVSLGPKAERSMRWTQATVEDLKAGIEAVQITNREGYWFEQPDFWSKYLRRPNELKNMCFAQFAKMYRGSGKKALENFDEDDQVEDYDEDITDESEEILESVKFNYIMTYRNNGVRGKKLPEHIILKNPIPGEASMMQKRRTF